MPIGVGLGMLLSGLLGGGFSLGGAKLQSNAATRAQQLQDRATREALEFERSRDARDYGDYLKERDRGWRFQDERESRLAPFRAGGNRGHQKLSSMILNTPSPRRGARSLADLLRGGA